jgi:hypothetical protein
MPFSLRLSFVTSIKTSWHVHAIHIQSLLLPTCDPLSEKSNVVTCIFNEPSTGGSADTHSHHTLSRNGPVVHIDTGAEGNSLCRLSACTGVHGPSLESLSAGRRSSPRSGTHGGSRWRAARGARRISIIRSHCFNALNNNKSDPIEAVNVVRPGVPQSNQTRTSHTKAVSCFVLCVPIFLNLGDALTLLPFLL